jgi:HSP20 family molecular chaperone IbpA
MANRPYCAARPALRTKVVPKATIPEPNWHVVERSYGSFSRAIPLPFDPDATKVEAKFDKGVLRIRVPKSAESTKKQQTIEIKKD